MLFFLFRIFLTFVPFFFFFFPPLSVRFYSEAGAERDVQRYESERRRTVVVGVEPGGDRHAVQPQDRDPRVRRATGDIRSERVRLARRATAESPDHRRGKPRGKPMERRSHGPEKKRSTTARHRRVVADKRNKHIINDGMTENSRSI